MALFRLLENVEACAPNFPPGCYVSEINSLAFQANLVYSLRKAQQSFKSLVQIHEKSGEFVTIIYQRRCLQAGYFIPEVAGLFIQHQCWL